jgi:hypothetical protein
MFVDTVMDIFRNYQLLTEFVGPQKQAMHLFTPESNSALEMPGLRNEIELGYVQALKEMRNVLTSCYWEKWLYDESRKL